MVATIQQIEGVIAAYDRATAANRRLPGRQGNVVEITAELADDVMITADLHGNRRNFYQIKKVAALDEHPRRHLILQEVCHGGPTYPKSGGCMSHGLLEEIAKLKAEYPDRVHFLMSNHELAELTDYPIVKNQKMLNLLFRLGMQEMYGPATEKVREAMLEFLRGLPLAVRLPGNVFVCHSLPEQVDLQGFDADVFEAPLDPLDLKEQGEVFRLVWGRDYRPENAAAFARMVQASTLIHGHEPCAEGFRVPNDLQIILDCCTQAARILVVPTDREFSHGELVQRIEPLWKEHGA